MSTTLQWRGTNKTRAPLLGKPALVMLLAAVLAAPVQVHAQYGYVATWPIQEAEWRTDARQRLEAKADFLRHVMATWLGFRRQAIMQGADPDRFATEVEFARSMLKEYVAEVLVPRIQAAAYGCHEGLDAIGYWLAYWRQVQLLGVAGDGDALGDPDFFVTVGGRTYPSMQDLPEQLLPTTVENCFREDYQHCVATGDFFRLYGRLFAFERQMQLLGQEMNPAWITLMVGYLERCGHWELEVTTRFRSEVVGTGVTATGTLRRTIELDWKQGTGAGIAALYGATIDGTAEPRVEQVAFTGGSCTVTPGPLNQNALADASLRALEWEYPENDPGTPDWAATGYPIRLALTAQPGSVRTVLTLNCPRSRRAPILTQIPFLFDGEAVVAVMFTLGYAVPDLEYTGEVEGSFKAMFETGWEFTALDPFRARLVREGNVGEEGAAVAARIEFGLRHAPE